MEDFIVFLVVLSVDGNVVSSNDCPVDLLHDLDHLELENVLGHWEADWQPLEAVSSKGGTARWSGAVTRGGVIPWFGVQLWEDFGPWELVGQFFYCGWSVVWSFEGLVQMHTLRSPPFLCEYARLDTQSVGSVTRLMTPLSSILSNSRLMESLRAVGVFNGGRYLLGLLDRRVLLPREGFQSCQISRGT